MKFLEVFLPIMFFVIGVIFSSFGNMLMYRMANDKPILKEKRSYCPNCHHQIAWYDNIPIFSWLILKGRCRHCHERISPRYLITELFGGILFLGIYFLYIYIYPGFNMSFEVSIYKLISAISISFILLALYVSAYVDFKSYVAPLSMSITMLVFAITKYLTYCLTNNDYGLSYLLGLSIPVVILLLIYFIGVLIMKKEPIGLGDVIIFGILGLTFGGIQLLLIVIVSSVLCSIIEIIKIKKTQQKSPIPFVPYIFIGALVIACTGPLIENGLNKLLGGN